MKRTRQPSAQMDKLLAVLVEQPGQWFYGYPLMKAAGLQSGTLYPLLVRMEGQGLVESEWREPEQPGRPPRHAYRLTAAGVTLARASGQRDADPDGVLST
ncbi:PadR family transcriptional regulator [Bacillus sp. NP157]|nr:PadR family transcriptional regulator [Bacillus sp. NP157]